MSEHKIHLGRTIELAEDSLSQGGFPVGALIVAENGEVFTGLSLTEMSQDVTHHAEVAAIRAARTVLGGTLYSSLEPCLMCLAACAWSGIEHVVFACSRNSVDPSYYETSLSANEAAQLFTKKPEVTFIPGFEAYAISLIEVFERRIVGG